MPTTIQTKRGLEANRSSVTPAAGEFLFTTDNKKVFIGDGVTAGGHAVGGAVAYEQLVKSENYTLVLSDAGKQIFHPASDSVVRTYTIPSNASVPYPTGTVLQFAVDPSGVDINVAINSDTLALGSGVTGTVRVDPGNILTAIKITSTKWLANYEYQYPYVSTQYVAVTEGSAGGQYINLYPWIPNVGFGNRYPTPGTVVATTHTGVRFAPNGSAIAAAHQSSPYISVWPLSGTSAGYGTKFSNPATLPTSTGNDVAWHPEMSAIAVAHASSPFVSVYPWSISGFGAKYANPGTLPANTGQGVAFSPAGNAIAVAVSTTPFIDVYAWNSSTGFGSRYSNPATLPAGNAARVVFSPAGDAIAIAHQNSPYLTVYPWNSSTGFGVKYSNPATLPTNNCRDIAFSPDGTAIAVAHAASPYVTVYPWSSSGFGVKYGNIGSGPTASNANGVTFSGTGKDIFVVEDSSPYLRAWTWNSSTGFGAAYNAPGIIPASTAQKVDFGYG